MKINDNDLNNNFSVVNIELHRQVTCYAYKNNQNKPIQYLNVKGVR